MERDFKPKSLAIINLAQQICEEYQADGYDLTLRQLYYQFIRRDFFPNTEQSYNRLGSIISDARMAGLIDWDHLTDRTRQSFTPYVNEEVETIFDGIEENLVFDRWKNQPVHIEVWVEKQALEEIVQRAANAMQVTYLACKGYMSSSEMHDAAMRMLRAVEHGKRVLILHLGDHDPSGIDMTRDIRDRLVTFIGHHIATAWGWEEVPELGDLSEAASSLYGCPDGADVVTVDRIALNMDQVRQYNPPPNPAKMTDSRANDYIEKFGRSSWELDALLPAQLEELIRNAVADVRNADEWNAAGRAEREARGDVLIKLQDAGLVAS